MISQRLIELPDLTVIDHIFEGLRAARTGNSAMTPAPAARSDQSAAGICYQPCRYAG
jgi:hypothetical protein